MVKIIKKKKKKKKYHQNQKEKTTAKMTHPSSGSATYARPLIICTQKGKQFSSPTLQSLYYLRRAIYPTDDCHPTISVVVFK